MVMMEVNDGEDEGKRWWVWGQVMVSSQCCQNIDKAVKEFSKWWDKQKTTDLKGDLMVQQAQFIVLMVGSKRNTQKNKSGISLSCLALDEARRGAFHIQREIDTMQVIYKWK
jgi:hypothetical protein